MNGMCKIELTGFQLKIIALLTMLIDHIGVVCPDMTFLRSIGRISFPIFAFLLSEGYHYSRDKRKYFLRLFSFSLLSEIPYNIFLFQSPFSFSRQNIFFTLSFAFLSIFLYEKCREKKMECFGVVSLLSIALIAELLRFDYGAFGIILILSFYFHYFLEKEKWWQDSRFLSPTTKKISCFILPILTIVLFKQGLPWSLFSFIFLLLYKGERGKAMKSFFYAFYPLHLLLLAFISFFLS